MGKGFGRIEKRRQQLEARKDKLQDLNEMVLFKLLILKHLYNLSNEEVEYQGHDRASFRRFLGLSGEAEIPDATTLDRFEQRLREAHLIDELFEQFASVLQEAGYEVKGGQIIDATLIPVPIQRNSREEKMVMTMGGKLVRAVGLERVPAQLGFKNLVYNLKRYVFWQKKTGLKSQV